MIADDEAKIRRGLSKLSWSELNIEVVGEAANGLEALEKFVELKPDIMLVDICMPFLNGLQLIGKLYEINPYCIVIIVSGFDEFEYAKEAVRLNVFDYILKPVNRNELMQTVKRGIEVLERKTKDERFIKWAQNQISTETSYLKQQFIKKWLDGKTTLAEVTQNFEAFKLPELQEGVMMVLQKLEIEAEDTPKMNAELMDFCILNIIEEIIEPFAKPILYCEDSQYYCVIVPQGKANELFHIEQKMGIMIQKYLKKEMIIKSCEISAINEVGVLYQKLKEEIVTEAAKTPLVLMALAYVEKHYHQPELSLQEVADQTLVSTAYLSRLIKKETGLAFTDYVQKVRIQKAIELMHNPTIKIFEISDRIGYSSQHYFSAAFKKVMGVSPNQYRGKKEGN